MDNEEKIVEGQTGIIEPVEIDQEMRSAYIDYSMSVIVSRALPDVRDGLKPVQRRVLFGMDGLGLAYSGPTRKCAKIVGEVLGKYHPHGDSSVYDALARLAQNWNQRYPTIFGQGNFGSMDGDPVAAMRYTEAKLQKITEDILGDIDKNTVDMVNNFDDTEVEPTVLPTKAPLLLLNGSSGIAVGMATNMAPHNLSECCDAICAYIDNPDIDTDGLMQYLPGPDFPTGGIIMGKSGIKEAYETGRGRVVVRSRTEIEVADNGRETIVVTEVPYMVNKKEMIEKIAQMVEDKKIEGISYINDETSREGVRIVIRVKQGFNSNVVLNTLFKYTQLQSSFAFNNVALVGGRPRTLSLKDLIANFVDFRHEVIIRRTRFDLEKAQKRAHILEGLLKAIDVIDEIIHIIRHSANVDEAKAELISRFAFTEVQATAIVEMRLRQLTGLEREKLQAEYEELEKFIARCNEILGSEVEQLKIIKAETLELKNKYGDARRTEIRPSEEEFNPEDFYANEDVVITISHLGYIKRTSLTEYRTQARGGVGMKGSATRDEDFIEHIYVANMHSTMLLFTQSGRCYWLKVYQIPEGSRASKGRAIQNIISIPDDKIKTYINVRTLNDSEYVESLNVVLVTKSGIIKKTALSAYSHPRAAGVNAVNLRDGDELVEALLTNGNEEILIAARDGRCCRFNETDARPMGRNSTGVRGINLEDDDIVVGAINYNPSAEDASEHTVLVVSENGFGKRTDFDEYRITRRGGKGVKTINITEKTGKLVAIKNVTENNDLMIIEKSGLTIRMSVSDIRLAGRATQGVKLINIKEGDSIAAVSTVNRATDSEESEGQGDPQAQSEDRPEQQA
ncbi:MAG: DNA gyrase subunit A [Bacteroidales bacterium]|uniref:DNA gyrase subunit A n=1 Tax=Candidatus Cryptobacteroides sp. TaxID=2952915 RepID=UPI002A74F72B|nr:DNA gyrase subunit A [Candidatus Cryptobacteroides sp.]MDD5914489.1 DNA gyrase subunit A [Bacteroidales bacterium]MDD7135954.1 DNA gyrase subunit A [Bacteroidales bacterium]MDD7235121.1 DNA gyrase subunit A [Bacteroidales bacterium]MDD7623489.1 DNA gyrase subunit A [Bacteroidales bacterium]MDY2701189.1 DNA gyrase subunit A [Candidatus Cryptobacteroides sp.]